VFKWESMQQYTETRSPAVAGMADRVPSPSYFMQNSSFHQVNNHTFGQVPMNTRNHIRDKIFVSHTVSEQMRVKDDSPCKTGDAPDDC
jgi:hypothetical protein